MLKANEFDTIPNAPHSNSVLFVKDGTVLTNSTLLYVDTIKQTKKEKHIIKEQITFVKNDSIDNKLTNSKKEIISDKPIKSNKKSTRIYNTPYKNFSIFESQNLNIIIQNFNFKKGLKYLNDFKVKYIKIEISLLEINRENYFNSNFIPYTIIVQELLNRPPPLLAPYS